MTLAADQRQSAKRRFLLVSPPSTAWNSRTHPHMGLAYLAGALRTAGYEVAIWDAAADETHETLKERLVTDRFDVVGISAPTPLIYGAWESARLARALGAITVLGGPHPTLLPDESMQQEAVDLVVRGEAERTIVELAAALGDDTGTVRGPSSRRCFLQEAMGSIAGLSWRNERGEVVHNADRALAADLDAIPFPAHDLFPMERYSNLNPMTDGLQPRSRAYAIVTSRGCPYKCVYCSKPITGHTWRARSVEDVVGEWRWLVRDLGATEIGITDDVWNLDPDRAKALCRELIAERLTHVPWTTIHGMRVTSTDPELFRLMKAAGCRRVGFGIESGSDRVLREIVHKEQDVATVRRAVGWAKEAGLEVMGFFVYGLPGETKQEMEQTTRLALDLDLDMAHLMLVTPFPGTELWERLVEQEHIQPGQWDQLVIQSKRAHFAPGDLPAEVVEQKWRQAYRRFYLRPRFVARILLRKDTWLRLPTYLQTAWEVLVGRKNR